jgi:transcriptional regulator with XRE-family HTH domain
MASGLDPMVQRRRLRVELRKAREAAGLSQKEVAPEMDWSLSKLIRIETGAVSISINDLRMLLQLYRVSDLERTNGLIAMARAAREPAWWFPYREGLSPEFTNMLSYESAASIIRNFQPMLVPGLLQTGEYARATLAEMVPPVAPDPAILGQVDGLVELRMAPFRLPWCRAPVWRLGQPDRRPRHNRPVRCARSCTTRRRVDPFLITHIF